MADNAPWVVTVALGCAGWFLTHTVDRVTESPTLEYELTTISINSTATAKLQLTNITRDHTFDEVKVDFLGTRGTTFSNPSAVTVQPADDGSTSPVVGGDTASFTVARMQPGNVYRLSVSYKGKNAPTVRITSDRSIIRPVPPSLETSFAKNEFSYLLAIGLIAGVGFWIYSYAYKTRRSPPIVPT